MPYQESPGSDRLKTVSVVLKAGETTLPIGLLVKLSDSATEPNEVVKCAADTDDPYGVVVNQAIAALATGSVCTDGECPALTGDTFSRGDALTVTSDGKVDAAASGDRVIGFALEDATAANQLRMILFKPGARLLA